MKLAIRPSRLCGVIAVPGSKSHTIRAIAAALAAHGDSLIKAPLQSADTRSALAAACALGAVCGEDGNNWRIQGTGGKFRDPGHVLDLGNSGTGLRMLCAMAANAGFPVAFDGDASLRTRLMAGELAALSELGCRTESCHGKCPLKVCGPLRGGRARVDGATSQFITSLLFAAPLAAEDSEFELDFLNEQPYVGITLNWLDRLGIRYEKSADLLRFHVFGRQQFHGFNAVIPADFSTAAFPLAAAAICGDGVKICNLDFNDVQGDKAVFDYFHRMGAIFSGRSDVTIQPAAQGLQGGVFDLNATPDALPIMAAAATLAQGETRLVNVPQARIKETDRISCMTLELRKMGAIIEELPDGMIIHGGHELHGAELNSHGDHRIAMALAVAALAAQGESLINDMDAATVTYPGFVKDFRALGADYTEIC